MPTPRIYRTPLDVTGAMTVDINQDSGRIFITSLNPDPMFTIVQRVQALDLDRTGKKTYSNSMPLPAGSVGLCPVEGDQFVVFENVGALKAELFDASFNPIETTSIKSASKYSVVQSIYDPDNQTILGVAFAPNEPPTEVLSFNPHLRTSGAHALPFIFSLEASLAYDSQAKTLFVGQELGQSAFPFRAADLGVEVPITISGFDLRALTVTPFDELIYSLFIVGATSAGEDQANEAIYRDRFLLLHLSSNPSELTQIVELSEGPVAFKLVNNEEFVYMVDVLGITQYSIAQNRVTSSLDLASGNLFFRPEVVMDQARNRIHVLSSDLESGSSELITIDCDSL
jgi:hypothetical protein